MEYTDFELNWLLNQIEEYLKQGNRAKVRFNLDSHSRPHMYEKLFAPVLGPDAKIKRNTFQDVANYLSKYERMNEGRNKKLPPLEPSIKTEPLPKVLELIFLFAKHKATTIQGFEDWIRSLDKGKFAPLIEASVNNEIHTIASNIDIHEALKGLIKEVGGLRRDFTKEMEKLRKENAFLNKVFKESYDKALQEGDEEVIKAFQRWKKDFE